MSSEPGLLLPDAERRRRTARLRAGAIGAEDAVRLALDRADAASGARAFLHLDRRGALRRARELDAAPGREGLPLFGVPVAVKDNIAVSGFPGTSGSALLETYRSPFDAGVTRRLREAGAVIVGTTNLDEFGMGSSTTRGARGTTRNPAAPEHVAGGSSGGSAAAVASGAAFAALGTDTGGSVRQPAAHCGLFGIRPTWGRVSRFGVTAYASSLDQVGVLAPDLPTLGGVLAAVSGLDPRDATSVDRSVPDFAGAAGRPRTPQVLTIPSDADLDALDPGSRDAFAAAVGRFESVGARIRSAPLPDPGSAVAAYYLIACAEASSNLSRFDGLRYGRREEGDGTLRGTYRASRSAGFGNEVRRRILLGAAVLSHGYKDAVYAAAGAARRRTRAELLRLLGDGGLLLLPVTPGPPRRLDEPDPPEAEYRADRFNILAALASLPALAIPSGRRSRLPFGVQLMGAPWEEARLISAAAAVEAR